MKRTYHGVMVTLFYEIHTWQRSQASVKVCPLFYTPRPADQSPKVSLWKPRKFTDVKEEETNLMVNSYMLCSTHSNVSGSGGSSVMFVCSLKQGRAIFLPRGKEHVVINFYLVEYVCVKQFIPQQCSTLRYSVFEFCYMNIASVWEI